MNIKIFLLAFAVSVGFFDRFNDNYQSMEINDLLKDSTKIGDYIKSNFQELETTSLNPLFPIKVNFKCKDNLLTFCGYSPIDCFAYRNKSSYCFFVILHSDSYLVHRISANYGKQTIEGDLQINGDSRTSYIWNTKAVNIYLKEFYSFYDMDKYKNCTLVAIGNMKFRELLLWSKK